MGRYRQCGLAVFCLVLFAPNDGASPPNTPGVPSKQRQDLNPQPRPKEISTLTAKLGVLVGRVRGKPVRLGVLMLEYGSLGLTPAQGRNDNSAAGTTTLRQQRQLRGSNDNSRAGTTPGQVEATVGRVGVLLGRALGRTVGVRAVAFRYGRQVVLGDSLLQRGPGSPDDLLRRVQDAVRTGVAENTSSTTSSEAAPLHCSQFWRLHGSSCYYLDTTHLVKDAALYICQLWDAKVVEVEGPEENTFVSGLLADHQAFSAWLGLNQTYQEGVYLWDTSRAATTYTSWKQGHPDQPKEGENCVITQVTGAWTHSSCDDGHPTVCEKEARAP